MVGGLKYRDFLRRIQLDERKRGKLTVTIEDPQGKQIAPGATYDAVDTVFLDFSTADPFVSLERYGLTMRTANNANPNDYDFPTLCGWLVSSGYGEGRHINDSKELVGQMELAKKSGILNYTPVGIRLEPDYYCHRDYGNTQQGWWDDAHWAKYKSLVAPYETFGKFCGKLHELGGVPFTYIQTNMPSNDFAIAHPEWMLNNDISRIHAEHRHHMPFVKFDFTDPGFQAHTLAMWKRLGKQGLEGIKFDYPESGWCLDGGFEDKSHTTTTAYRKIFQLCRAGLGDKAYIHERNLGEYGTPCLDVTAGIVDLQRVWADSSHFEPEMASRMGLRWYKNRSVFGYYPDGKSFKKMDTDARRTMLGLVGLISGRLELGTSFGSMKPEEQHDLTRLYPVLKGTQSFRPVDMLVEGRNDLQIIAAVRSPKHVPPSEHSPELPPEVDRAVMAGDYGQAEELLVVRQSALHAAGIGSDDLRWGENELALYNLARRGGDRERSTRVLNELEQVVGAHDADHLFRLGDHDVVNVMVTHDAGRDVGAVVAGNRVDRVGHDAAHRSAVGVGLE